MTEKFIEFIQPRRRGRILQILAGASSEQGCNVPMLRTLLRESGYQALHEVLRTDLAILAEQGLVRLREVGEVQIATITTNGEDIVSGELIVPGITLVRKDR